MLMLFNLKLVTLQACLNKLVSLSCFQIPLTCFNSVPSALSTSTFPQDVSQAPLFNVSKAKLILFDCEISSNRLLLGLLCLFLLSSSLPYQTVPSNLTDSIPSQKPWSHTTTFLSPSLLTSSDSLRLLPLSLSDPSYTLCSTVLVQLRPSYLTPYISTASKMLSFNPVIHSSYYHQNQLSAAQICQMTAYFS